MTVTAQTLATIANAPVNSNMAAMIAGLIARPSGLDRPHRLMHYLGQTGHESGGWKYDHELWGPTAAQVRYEGRADLGNAHTGDGFKFRGRGPIQVTGRSNYTAFTAWARGAYPFAPDFTLDPDALLTDPWEGLAPIWFWTAHDLNNLADLGDIVLITRKINGGTNGLAQRMQMTGTAGAVLFGLRSVREFQTMHGLTPDGKVGPLTLGTMHRLLSALPPVTFAA